MNFCRKNLVVFDLILLVLHISVLRGSDVEEEERNQFMIHNDICTFYHYSLLTNNFLFHENYKPLIVIIAREFLDGINRVRNISQSKRIMVLSNGSRYERDDYGHNLYKLIEENFYLFEAHNVYYFVYPVNIMDNYFTVYCQKILLNHQLGVTFDFVNVKKEHPFFEDILVPLKPNCSSCPLEEYVTKKLLTGQSFSELFTLREHLFSEKTKYVSLKAFDNDYACDSIGFNINSENKSFLMHFNSLLQQIQNNNNNTDESRRSSFFEKSLKCFKSKDVVVFEDIFDIDIQERRNLFTLINYLNWINNTVFQLNANDTSFGNICKDKHKIYTFKLFCFIKDVSDITSYNTAAWIEVLQQLVANSFGSKLNWFNNLMLLRKNVYSLESELILRKLENLRKQIKNASLILMLIMTTAYNWVSHSMSENSKFASTLNAPCLIYNYWETIDALLPEMNFKRLVIIVTGSMLTGIRKVDSINGRRVVPKIKRENLHYSKQFVYDEIIRYFYLFQSNDTYYYVYSLTLNENVDAFITYFEYKMISDYSKVVFYFEDFSDLIIPNEVRAMGNYKLLISALPDNCHLLPTNCTDRFFKPIDLIYLHQQFHKRYSKYLPLYGRLYYNLLIFGSNYHSHSMNNYSIEYAQKFYEFLKTHQNTSYADNLFSDFRCRSFQKINKRINIDFGVNEKENLVYFFNLTQSAYRNISTINITNNDTLKYFCMNSNVFRFIKLFCYLKINYIDGMRKIIGAKSNYTMYNMYAKEIAENEKNVITEYLSKTLKWINATLWIDYFEMYHNEAGILSDLQLLYSEIPNVISNDSDLFNKIYLVMRETLLYSSCNNYTKEKDINLCLI